jgi:hypothetical protein
MADDPERGEHPRADCRRELRISKADPLHDESVFDGVGAVEFALRD